ncbi:MAG: hypothetical protein IT371_20305 [Deltaproteobacteria bacterium]|nr:hypothetical protein [Deltaproteobacteria bacterium]
MLMGPQAGALVLLALTVGCQASPPAVDDGGAAAPPQGPYASVAHCTPVGQPERCPGAACGALATGRPDQRGVELAACGTLDAAFVGGTAVARVGTPDLAIHLGGSLSGLVRVEASEDGLRYVVAGFFPSAPSGTVPDCRAVLQPPRVLLDFDRCNSIANVRFLRLSRDPQVGGAPTIDAIEALSFSAR